MIGVIGATGNTGRAVAAELKNAEADFVCLVRNPEKAHEVLGSGIRTVVADIDDPTALAAGLEGLDRLFIVTGHHPGMAEQHHRVFQAAKDAGIRHIVKVSGGTAVAKADSESIVGRAHHESEKELMALGTGWTILRPGLFMQNILSQIPLIKEEKKAVLPFAGDLPIALIDVRDIGAVGAKVILDADAHNGKTYAFTGNSSSMGELTKAISAVIGDEITYIGATLEQAEAGMRTNGMPDWLVGHMLAMANVGAAGGFSDPQPHLIKELTGSDPRSVDDFARDHAGLFK